MDQKDQISPKDQEPAHCELISRRRFLIYLGILFGSIIAGLSLLRNLGIKTINRFRINSIKQSTSWYYLWGHGCEVGTEKFSKLV
jgi:hypothetical protein